MCNLFFNILHSKILQSLFAGFALCLEGLLSSQVLVSICRAYATTGSNLYNLTCLSTPGFMLLYMWFCYANHGVVK